MRMPPMPELPDFLRGRELVVIDGAVLGSDERGRELLGDLRALRPEMDTFGRVPAKSLVRLHMDPEGGAPFASDSAMLGSLPGRRRSTPSSPQVGPGAHDVAADGRAPPARRRAGPPARGRRGAQPPRRRSSSSFAGAIAATPEMGAQGHADAVRLTEALAPYANGRQYLNFAENPVDARTAYADGVWTQLKGIRSAVDPHGIFAANHPVPRLFENGTITP